MTGDADTIEPIIPGALRCRPTIEAVTYLQVCDRIEPERGTIEAMRFETPLAEHWSALTEPLPLAGGKAMRPAAAPWAAALVDDIARDRRRLVRNPKSSA